MPHVQGQARDAVVLFPPSLDEYITPDNPVRFIDAFVDQLDLQALGFARVIPAETGRPAFHPGDLLKLYVYGYLNRSRSSRQLERETQRTVEVMWRLKRLTPDFKRSPTFGRSSRTPSRQCVASSRCYAKRSICSAAIRWRLMAASFAPTQPRYTQVDRGAVQAVCFRRVRFSSMARLANQPGADPQLEFSHTLTSGWAARISSRQIRAGGIR